jgi:hypothetical protein
MKASAGIIPHKADRKPQNPLKFHWLRLRRPLRPIHQIVPEIVGPAPGDPAAQ